MNAAGVIYLGWRYLKRNRGKTALLVAAFTLVWLLPSSLALVVGKIEEQVRSRAEETPLLLGQAGSPLELIFNGLYFTKPGIATMPYGEIDRINDEGLGIAVPLYARFSAGGHRIVGTTLDYFDTRGLEVAQGRGLMRLGECVVGASVAEKKEIRPGDAIISTPETLFDIAGVYPLKMQVVGALKPTGTADDAAIFVDLKTAWIIEGLGHGHDEAETLGDEARLAPVSDGEEGTIRLNASVVEYNEITKENADSFHFHGELTEFPISAAIVLPRDAKSQALLKGHYGKAGGLQLVTPSDEMDELFATVFSVQTLVLRLLGMIGLATLAIGALVFTLSNRLRREEFRHLRHLGADQGTLRAMLAFEAAFVIVISLLLCALGLVLLEWITPTLVRQWLS